MIKNKQTLQKRRTTAIIASAIAVVILAIALVVVLDYVRTYTLIDPADNSTYYIRYKNGKFILCDSDKKTPIRSDNAYGYYELRSGNLVAIDQEAGSCELFIVDDTVGNETYEGYNYSLMMFPQVKSEFIRQLEVFNDKGSFTFYRYDNVSEKPDDSADFKIKDSEMTEYDQELFADLYVDAGYTIIDMKIDNPIKDANGEYSEYGLVPVTRYIYDEHQTVIDTYEHVPSYYVLTDTSGKQYKVIIGEKLTSGTGYYVQYVDITDEGEVKRDAVYVLPTDSCDTLLSAVEDFVTPQLTYPMSLNDYYDVEDFFIYELELDENNNPKEYSAIIGFTFEDLADRENTIQAARPYVFATGVPQMTGYFPSDSNISACLQALYSPSFSRVVKLDPTESDFEEYNLRKVVDQKYDWCAEYLITFKFDIRDEDGKIVDTIENEVYFSAKTESNTRYAYTTIYFLDKDGNREKADNGNYVCYSPGAIVEVNPETVDFLTWDSFDWITEQYFNLNIAFCKQITIETSDYLAEFILDNSKSGMVSGENIKSDKISITAKSPTTGESRTTFSEMTFVDEYDYTWTITTSTIKLQKDGQDYKITNAYYDRNKLNEQTLSLKGYIACKDGSKVYVTGNEVKVVPLRGETVIYDRYDTSVFRLFYQTLLYSNIINSHDLTPDQASNLEENKMLKITVLDTDDTPTTYTFYRIAARKAFIRINDATSEKGFYVMTDRVDKIVSDAQKFFSGDVIDPTAKH